MLNDFIDIKNQSSSNKLIKTMCLFLVRTQTQIQINQTTQKQLRKWIIEMISQDSMNFKNKFKNKNSHSKSHLSFRLMSNQMIKKIKIRLKLINKKNYFKFKTPKSTWRNKSRKWSPRYLQKSIINFCVIKISIVTEKYTESI